MRSRQWRFCCQSRCHTAAHICTKEVNLQKKFGQHYKLSLKSCVLLNVSYKLVFSSSYIGQNSCVSIGYCIYFQAKTAVFQYFISKPVIYHSKWADTNKEKHMMDSCMRVAFFFPFRVVYLNIYSQCTIKMSAVFMKCLYHIHMMCMVMMDKP